MPGEGGEQAGGDQECVLFDGSIHFENKGNFMDTKNLSEKRREKEGLFSSKNRFYIG